MQTKQSLPPLCSVIDFAKPALIGSFQFQLLCKRRFLVSSQKTQFIKNNQTQRGESVSIHLPNLLKVTLALKLQARGLPGEAFPRRNPISGRGGKPAAATVAAPVRLLETELELLVSPANASHMWVICHLDRALAGNSDRFNPHDRKCSHVKNNYLQLGSCGKKIH